MRHSDVAHCCAIIRIVFHLSRAINFPPIRAKSLTWAAQWRQETQVRLKLSTRCHLSCLRRPSVCLRCMSGFPARACPPAMMIDRDVLCHHRLFHRGARSIRRPRSLKKMPVTSLLRPSPSHVIWGLWYAVLVWHSHTTNRSVLLPSACERHTPWETRERERERERGRERERYCYSATRRCHSCTMQRTFTALATDVVAHRRMTPSLDALSSRQNSLPAFLAP